MPLTDFTQHREQVQRQRRDLDARTSELLLAVEKRKQLQARRSALERIFDPENADHRRRREELDARIAETDKRIGGLAKQRDRLAAELNRTLSVFWPLTDPRERVEELDDRYPVLLMPLRIETRFKRFADPDGDHHELWVRVYPDECAVDTFEASLSETEVRHARTYFAQLWRAGENEADQRAAWRNLAASHGSGRARWIVANYTPLNPDDQPDRHETSVILVIVTDAQLPAAERDAAERFWADLWRAGEDGRAANDAREALIAAVGSERAEVITQDYRPFNMNDAPPEGIDRDDALVVVATLIFESEAETETRRRAWSRAPRVAILPDRLVLMGWVGDSQTLDELSQPIPSPLIVGPDPQAPRENQIRQDGDDIAVSEEMKWMVDFETALASGMAFRIPLSTEAWNRGFDRLMVLGVRLGSDEQDGRERLEALFDNHQFGRSGLTLLPQGTATNNTEEAGAAFHGGDDPDVSFDLMAAGGWTPDPGAGWFERTDGQWLSDWLGISPERLRFVPHAGRGDVGDAQAMNVALWPSTLGYTMDTLLSNVFDDATVGFTRDFFCRYVSGRGMTPALRIGKQPYGIVPAMAFSRLAFPLRGGRDDGAPAHLFPGSNARLAKLYEILMRAYGTWGELLSGVSFVGKSGDPHQILLDVLGLHATSVEHFTRTAQSLEQVINSMNLSGLGGAIARILLAIGLLEQGTEILRDHGYDVDTEGRPDLLDKYFRQEPTPMTGDLIDDQPLSETDPVRPYTTDGRNYLAWLADTARVSLETVRLQSGFGDDGAPSALLYRMLRHALLLGYYDTSRRLYERAGVLSDEALRAARSEANFVHIADQTAAPESRFQLLYQPEPKITGGDPKLLVGEFIPGILFEDPLAAPLGDLITAIDRLKDLSTARLERIFAEHLDTCSYRLDAWIQGMVNLQLGRMRFEGVEGEGARRGLYLGAWGWLENVRPEEGTREPVGLQDPALREVFERPSDPPLMRDTGNAGYVHAPSLNQAVTAAVLRNGYLSNADRDEPEVFNVNLSSERVRRALAVLEGIQNGQSLSALLGYQFERGLHDRHGEAEVDKFIYPLRKQFPLRADHMADTASEADVPIEAIEARNVLDGVALVEHIEKSGEREYPFGIGSLPTAGPTQKAAITAEAERLLDTNDAVADLGIAEGIHQVVQGNYDRAAASTEAFSKGKLPPRPEVVETPRSGFGLTHRVGLHLPVGLGSGDTPVPGLAVTPRAAAEPALNHWLAAMLPAPGDVAVVVRISDGTGLSDTRTLTQEMLGLQPLDLLYLLKPESEQAMSALDDRITAHVIGDIRPDGEIAIAYTERIPGRISFFELAALAGHLRALVMGSRPLRGSDVALPNEAGGGAPPLPDYRVDRLADVLGRLVPPLDELRALHAELTPLLADPAANESDLVDPIDTRINRLVDALGELERFGLPQTGFGFALAWKRERYRVLLKKVGDLVDRWQERLDRFDAGLGDYDAQPAGISDEVRIEQLRELEKTVSMVLTDPVPSSPAAYRAIVVGRRGDLQAKQGVFVALLATTTPDLSGLLDAVRSAASDLQQFDFVRLDLDKDVAEIVRFSGDIHGLLTALIADLRERQATAGEALTAYESAATPTAREKGATDAARALLGEDFRVVPEFRLSAAAGDELANAWGDRAPLLDHLRTVEGIDFPVDDWLYGVARVREQMGHWEAVTLLAEALAGVDPDLHPLQLPYRDSDSWLALPHPSDYVFDGERVLYTAHYAVPFDRNAAQCGLLLDEWTEVLPTAEETTGLTFHYDRPNSEPPQAMLLATPPRINGRWEWADIVDAVRETMELARRRAVEPDHVDGSSYSRFLPATVSAMTAHPITIALNLAVSNPSYEYIDPGSSDA